MPVAFTAVGLLGLCSQSMLLCPSVCFSALQFALLSLVSFQHACCAALVQPPACCMHGMVLVCAALLLQDVQLESWAALPLSGWSLLRPFLGRVWTAGRAA